jgi:hypothetical protein
MKPQPDKAELNLTSRPFMISVVIGFATFLITISAHSQTRTGQQIFDRMLQVYAQATTYQDSGRVTQDFYEPRQQNPQIRTIRNFETAYDRTTGQFRFHYKVEYRLSSGVPDEMVIWTKGDTTYRWWTIDDSTSQEESLASALAIATGVSATSSRKIPGLLLAQPMGAGWGIDSLRNIKLIGNAIQDGRPCYRLTGIYWKNKVAFLWVDQQSFLLLRLDEGAMTPGKKFKTSITYQPILNKPIPSQALVFEPPQSVEPSQSHFFWGWLRSKLWFILFALVILVWALWNRNRGQARL